MVHVTTRQIKFHLFLSTPSLFIPVDVLDTVIHCHNLIFHLLGEKKCMVDELQLCVVMNVYWNLSKLPETCSDDYQEIQEDTGYFVEFYYN